jgi:alpha-1,6-mannosyltransferase
MAVKEPSADALTVKEPSADALTGRDSTDSAHTMQPPRVLRIVDVAMFYGERGGGIHTYLEAKAAYARRTGAFDHHLVIPGRATSGPALKGREPPTERHEQPSVRLAVSNGYRVPLGSAGLQATLRALVPDVVLLHDPYWTPRLASRTAHEIGAAVVAVYHSSAALHAAGLPGPHGVYTRALRCWYRRAYVDVDAVMSVVDSDIDARRPPTLRLRLGLDPAFGPRVGVPRGEHVLYVGRLAREKGLRELLEAAAAARDQWPLVLLGTGPAGDTLRERARQLGLGGRIRFAPYVQDRNELAQAYSGASCVVLPGAYETFGLAALEAAACGTPVVTADQTPSARLIEAFVETFRAGDPTDLLLAIERARALTPDPESAAALAARNSWEHALSAELADIQRLIGRL